MSTVLDDAPQDIAAHSVQCPCGKLVTPTVPGGNRPRPHNDPATDQRCTKYSERTAAVCKRCGGPPNAPRTVTRGGVEVPCKSNVFHPQRWFANVDGVDGAVEVGNPAACGEILGVSGEQWLWRVRQPEPGSPSRAPEADGYDLKRRTPYWRLSTVEQFNAGLPSRNKQHRGKARDHAEAVEQVAAAQSGAAIPADAEQVHAE